MLDKPLTFAAINVLLYTLILGVFGFSASSFLSVFFAIGVFIYNYKFLGWQGSITLAIIYLLCFDSQDFYFSDANIRIWYILLIILYIYYFYKFLDKKSKLFVSKENIIQYIAMIFLLIWSLYFFISEEQVAKSYNLKYWIFYIGLLLILNNFYKHNIQKFDQICDYLISLSIFICFFGIIQFVANIFFFPNYQREFYNIRPNGFFSETTWYSEYIFFGLLLVVLKILTKKNALNYIYFIPFFIIGIIISVTRNTFLSLLIYLGITFLLSFIIENKLYKRVLNSFFFKTITVIGVMVLLFLIYKFQDLFLLPIEKLNAADDSAQGRFEAYNLSIDLIKNGSIFGNGFYWDETFLIQSSGTSIGAKSFNLLLMIAYVFGLFGLILFLVIMFFYFCKTMFFYIKTKSIFIRYSIIVFLCFFQMAMFAPIHQFPFGILIVSLSVLLFQKGKNPQIKQDFDKIINVN